MYLGYAGFSVDLLTDERWFELMGRENQSWRLDNGDPEVLEIVLDKPIPLNVATRFIFNDGGTTNVVGYSYILGDSDADGLHTLRDFASLQNCFDKSALSNNCSAFDFDGSSLIDFDDYSEFNLVGP